MKLRAIQQLLAVHLLCILVCETWERILTPCELARELHKLGVKKQEIPTWTCIARYESKFNTSAIGLLNGNWSNDFGIFQVSDRYWCQSKPERKSANMCGMDCQRLLSDDLSDAVKCAQIVKQRQGWQAWAVYRGLCERRKTKIFSDCL